MRKVVVFIAQSLDGYIATTDDRVDWLFDIEGEGDNGYSEFYATIDTLIMGRRTYDWVAAHMDTYPYMDKISYVVTSQRDLTEPYINMISGDVVAQVKALKQQAGQSIWLVGGGQLIATLLEHHVVDELIITVAPLLLGQGIALFPAGGPTAALQLLKQVAYGQFVALHYAI